MSIQFPVQELQRLAHIGTGTSLFQADPLIYGQSGRLLLASDWEYLIDRKQHGLPNSYSRMEIGMLPKFMEKSDAYIERSCELGCNIFRFSFEFPRLCPQPNIFDERLMTRYVGLLARIHASGQKPFVTMYHYTMPLRLVQLDASGIITDGAWEHERALEEFAFYVRGVATFLQHDDKMRRAIDAAGVSPGLRDKLLAQGVAQWFMSINEPAAVASHAYLSGIFHPHKHADVSTARKVLKKLVAAHDIVREELRTALHRKLPPHVGVGYNWQHWVGPLAPAQRFVDRYISNAFERNGSYTDFVGEQYYFRLRLPPVKYGTPGHEWSDHDGFGEIDPAGIRYVLEKMHHAYPRKPIYVTEFGFPDASDIRRPFWILETVRHILEARKVGIPVDGALYWSLVDNFEWDRGMAQRFGLFSEAQLDYAPSGESGRVCSWQVWQALCSAARFPSALSNEAVQQLYERAQVQYASANQVQRI